MAKHDDPRERGAKPDYPAQPQQAPGTETQMRPKPDHGEKTYRGSERLTGKVALITGGDSGIGRAVALAFAREGADVAISYLPEEEADAVEAAEAVTAAGRRALRLPGDIRDEGWCKAMVERTIAELGSLDVLVNNAAFQTSRNAIEEIEAAEFDRIFRTNVYAMFFLCKAALPKMKEGSSIINVASIQAYDPSPTLLPYAATKGAIVTFSKALAQMAIERGVRVNVVAPGPVWTPLIVATLPPDAHSKFGKGSPMERPAQPAELAPAFVFLASKEASYVNGEVLGVTGGRPLA